MKVVVPYTQIHPSLEGALTQSGVSAEFVKLTSEDAYWRLLCRLWDEGETFIIVEHDVLPGPGALQDLWDCPEPWCAQPYKIFGKFVHSGLGCTKIREELMQFRPSLPHQFSDRSWRRLDTQLVHGAMPILPHRHGTPVLHMNGGSWGHFGPESREQEAWVEAESRRHASLLRSNPEYLEAFIKWSLGIQSAAPISVRAAEKRKENTDAF